MKCKFYGTDLSGSQDGSVSLWEWNHQQAIASPRPAGTFAKVTRVGFNQQGNKFGVTDSDGNLSLWQVVATQNKPFFVCFNRNDLKPFNSNFMCVPNSVPNCAEHSMSFQAIE